jgi:hypothetical protein
MLTQHFSFSCPISDCPHILQISLLFVVKMVSVIMMNRCGVGVAALLLVAATQTGVEAFSVRPYSISAAPKSATRLSVVDPSHFLETASLWLSDAAADLADPSSSAPVNVGDAGFSTDPVTYSKASYYTTLGLYALSFPGLWSQIKRSTAAKTKRKTFVRCVCVFVFCANCHLCIHVSHPIYF